MAERHKKTKAAEIAKHLNSLNEFNLSSLAPTDDFLELIEDYLVADEDGSDSSDTEDDDSEAETRSKDNPPPADIHAPSTSQESLQSVDYESDEEQFTPFEDLGMIVTPVTDEGHHDQEKTLESVCACKGFKGQKCFIRFDREMLEKHRINSLGLSREELDISILSKLSCGIHIHSHTTRSRQKSQSTRKKHRTDFYFHGFKVCRGVFRYLNGIGQDKLNSLLAHYKADGIEARSHKGKKRQPKHALTFDDIKGVSDFIINYAQIHAITLPGRTPHHWRADVRLLPTNCTKKTVYDNYKDSCGTSRRCVAYNTFRRLWQDLLPFISTMRPATDLCWVCQQGATRVARAINKGDGEKNSAYLEMAQHLETVTKERSVYTGALEKAKSSLPVDAKLGRHPPCSCEIISHYSFDFAQQVHYPSNPLQPGPIFFKTPRKCGLFGVCCEALPSQVNFLLDEACSTGKGANCVVSLLHYFFEHYGLGETNVHLHADNCSGQNKNSCMIMYLMWRVLTSRHKRITLSFLITGHTKFSPDWCFGLVKRLYRRTKVDCLDDIASVVNKSSVGNRAQLCGNEKGEVFVPMYDWTNFLKKYFRKVVGIKKYHHFDFETGSGSLSLREFSDSDPVSQNLLLSLPLRGQMPSVITPYGLDAKRQWYLYNEIRPFVDERWKDLVTPKPICPLSTVDDVESEGETSQPPPTKVSRRGVETGGKGGVA